MNAGSYTNGEVRRDIEPHQNVALERALLGGLLSQQHPGLLAALPELGIEDFYDWRNQVIFTAIRSLEMKRTPIDTLTVTTEVARLEKLDAVTAGYLASLELEGFGTHDNLLAYAELLRVHHRNRDVQKILGDASRRSATWKHDPRELLSEIIGDLQRLESGGAGGAMRDLDPSQNTARWTTPLPDFLGDVEPDDDDAIDWIIRDIVPRAEAVLLGGPMKAGKTWNALDLAITIALGQKWLGSFENTLGSPAKTLGVFLEDNRRRLSKRLWELTRAHGTTPNNDLLQDNLRLTRTPLRLPDPADQRRFIAEIKAWGASFVVVDNLTRVMVGDPNKTTDAAAFTRAWLEIVEETGASVMFLHHTRKPSGDQKQIDPFDTLRGSGDFGAAARNIIVATPIRTETDEKLSEVRMRGNLDLRRESFTLAFERKNLLRWQARLVDRGDIEQIKSEVAKATKETKEAKKVADYRAQFELRKQRAIAIAQAEGYVTQAKLAHAFGMASPRGMAPVFESLCQDKILRAASDNKRGYELADAPRQVGLL